MEMVDHFVKEVNLNESKINHEQKKVNSEHQVSSEKFSSLLASAGSAEELSTESTCAGIENQDKGLLLNGTFNEEDSAKSFQEALLQWRKGNRDHREQLHASEVLSELVGICEVQTNLTVMKEPIHVEFKKDGLSYMEKLLLKKYRRTPVDQFSDSCVKDSRPTQTLSVPQALSGEGGEEDDFDDLTVEDVKRYWTSVFREQIPNSVSESAESSLKIEFLDDSYGKDLEESSNFLLKEAGGTEMIKQERAEPLKQFERNPVSSEEVSQGKIVECSHLERSAAQKESIELKPVRKPLNSCELPELPNPTELISSKYLLERQLQKNKRDSQELDGVCDTGKTNFGLIMKSSLLQDVAKRQKSVSTRYWGLEGFFVGANCKQVLLEAPSPLCADSGPVDGSILFPGDGKWVTERSFSEYADDSVVQGALESHLNRLSSGLETPNRISSLVAGRLYSGNSSRRPLSTNMLHCELSGNCPTNTQPRPKSSPVHTLRVNTEISKNEGIDITKQDEDLWQYIADQEALLILEKELLSYTGPEKHYSLTSEDVNSPSRHSEKICRNSVDFHKNLELKDESSVDTLRGWDESQVDDEEEILEDKQQVLALQ